MTHVPYEEQSRRVRERSDRRTDRAAPSNRQQCGTRRGYEIHQEQDEVACRLCRKAWADYYRQKRQEKRGRQ